MGTTKLSTKGQLIIPKEIRDRHGWEPGTELDLEDQGDSVLIRRVPQVPPTTVDEVVGCLRFEGRPRTLEEMEEAVAREAAKRR